MTVQERPSSYRWVVIVAFFGISESAALVSMSIGVMLPPMTEDLRMSPVQAGMLGSVFWLATGVLSVPMSIWLSRYNPKNTITVAILIAGLLTFAQAWAPTYELELLGRAAFSIAMVARLVVFALIVQQWFESGEVTTVQAVSGGLLMIGQTIAMSATAPWIAAIGGWRNAMVSYGVLILISAVLWHILGRERVTERYLNEVRLQERAPLRSVLKYKEIWIAAIGFVGGGLGWTAFMTFWPTFLLTEKGVPLATGGYLLSILPLGCIAGSIACKFVIDKVGYKKPIIIAAAIGITLTRLGGLWGDVIVVWAALTFVQGVLIYLSSPILLAVPYELKGIKPREVAIASAFIISVMTIGSTVGPVMVGYIYQLSGSWLTSLMIAFLTTLSLLLPGFGLPETGRRAKRAEPEGAPVLEHQV